MKLKPEKIQNYKDYTITIEAQKPSVPTPQTDKEWDEIFDKHAGEIKGTHKWTIHDKDGKLLDQDDQNMWDTQACLDNEMNEIEHIINDNLKIDKNLVIDFKDILADNNPDAPTYNNMNFYLSNEKRLRFKICQLDSKFYKDNKFFNCFDRETLKILKPGEWNTLSKMDLEDMKNLVDACSWDWLGDDFDDMQDYLDFVELHNPNYTFSTKINGKGDDYMDVYLHDISMYNDKEKEIYKKGISDGSST